MEKNVYLNEEEYQKSKKKISLIAIIVLIVGFCIGGCLIYNGVAKPNLSKVDILQKELEEKRKELIDKGVVYDETSEYTDGEAYDLMIITDALDPGFHHCKFDEYKTNSITKEYCSAKNSVGYFATNGSIIFGAFICIATCMISAWLFSIAKGREIVAFQTQQVMPVAKEGIDAIAPNIGNVAKEVSKGIKEGIIDDKE